MNWERLAAVSAFAIGISIGFQFVLIGVSLEATIRGGAIALALVAGLALLGRFAADRNQGRDK